MFCYHVFEDSTAKNVLIYKVAVNQTLSFLVLDCSSKSIAILKMDFFVKKSSFSEFENHIVFKYYAFKKHFKIHLH